MARIETDEREGFHTLWLAATAPDDRLIDAATLGAVAAHIRAMTPDAGVRVSRHDGIACIAINGDKVGRNHGLLRGCETLYERGCKWIMTTSDFGWLKTYLREHA
jgi:hypothetical protein